MKFFITSGPELISIENGSKYEMAESLSDENVPMLK